MNPLEIIKFVEQNVPENERLNALALLADPPAEDFEATAALPNLNELPAFKVGSDSSIGNNLANLGYGVAAPVIGQESENSTPSIGELLTGDLDGLW